MILSNINKYKYIYKLLKLTKILNKTQVSNKLVKNLVTIFKQKFNNNKIFPLNPLKKKKVHENVIRYIINIIAFPSNTVINITDVSGKVLITISDGLVNDSKESKKSKYRPIVKIFKSLLLKASFIKNKAVAINFKKIKRYQESFFIKVLKPKVFIKSVQSYTSLPHNGCRPKKLKKRKIRTKRLILK